MQKLICYKSMPEWNSGTLPDAFRQRHNTKEGAWAKLTLLQGSLTFEFLSERDEVLEAHEFTPRNPPPLVEPLCLHRISGCSADMRCRLEFFCLPEDYFHLKYDMTRTHSEVINAVSYLSPANIASPNSAQDTIAPAKVLDLGCGGGRNALYLSLLGFNVTAYDKSQQSIDALKAIADSEQQGPITAEVFDINQQPIKGRYDFILSTVVLMFLQADKIARVIQDMQQSTNANGLNLIVAAMSTEDYPCPLPFPFTFHSGELANYYRDWEIVKYNEEVGELHKTDADGNRIKLRFATLLARKRR